MVLGNKTEMNVNTCFLKKSLLGCIKNVNSVQTTYIHNRARIGNRDWVGWGRCGRARYADDMMFPFPAIRFRENSNELLALREKEKGDWRKLSIEEKKCLYRASFRQTLVEKLAPTGQWKSILGWTLFLSAFGIWTFMAVKLFIYPPLPVTFEEKRRRGALRRELEYKIGAYNGISSKWDYDNDTWKK